MELIFTSPMTDFSAYFTYLAPLTLSFFDTLNNLEGTVSSLFLSNLALSGDPGSGPITTRHPPPTQPISAAPGM